jgi:hypothetical protein
MKIPNVGYHLARAEGRAIRALYAAALLRIVARAANISRSVSFDVCSYSGEATLPEQIASIRSFLRYAGRPRRFTVYSDGSHSARSMQLLRNVDSCVEVTNIPQPQLAGPTDATRSYLETHPTGRQLALMMSLPVEQPTFYIDSDVLFFPGAAGIESQLIGTNAPALFLPDCRLSADERVFHTSDERADPVNTGMVFFRHKLDWSRALDRLLELNAAPNFFTNQTLTHLVMHANRAAPLDSEKFVLQLDDQFLYRDLHAQPEIVARHYVNPVRHKFWTALLR